jgi:hypothetical protein
MGGLSWRAHYLAWYEACDRIGLDMTDEQRKLLRTHIDIFKIGIYDLLTFENLCIVCKLPKYVKRDNTGRLHSVTSPAVEFRSGYSLYSIHGVTFEKELWEKVTSRTITTSELLQIKSVDQRFVAMNHFGFENLLDKINKKLIDTGKYGNKLYQTKFSKIAVKFLTYPDIDGKGQRLSFVDPKFKKADEAMAWKHNCTVNEYYKMRVLQSWNT